MSDITAAIEPPADGFRPVQYRHSVLRGRLAFALLLLAFPVEFAWLSWLLYLYWHAFGH